jgi:hypothetical protein
MKQETVEALTELAKAAAKQQGWDESEPFVIMVSNQTEPNVCDKHCGICQGLTHHWNENFETDEEGEIINPDAPVWSCKHCSHSVPYGEPENHPSGCDCPDCAPDENWLCNCGEFIEDGYHCPNCGCEPPWGCPCSGCQDGDDEDDDLSYSDVTREDWDY